MLKTNNKKGYIYKLTDGENDYYGSCLNIRQRKYGHNRHINDCSSKELNKDKTELIVLEELDDITDYLDPILLWRERYYIENFKCVNKQRPIITETEKKKEAQEYCRENKEKIKEYQKKNKEKYDEYKKKHYKENKESIQKYQQEYQKENKEFINRRVCCRYCKCELSMSSWNKHTKTAKHIKNSLDSV